MPTLHRSSRAVRTITMLATVLVLAGFGCAKEDPMRPSGSGGPAASTGGALGVRGTMTAPPARPVGEPSRDVPVLSESDRAALKGATAVTDQGGSISAAPTASGDEDVTEELIATYALADVAGGYSIGWVSLARIEGKVMVTGTFSLEPPKEGLAYVAKLVKRGASTEVLRIGALSYDASTKQGTVSYTVGSADVSGYDAFVVTQEAGDGSGSAVVLEGLRSTDF